MAEYIEHEHNKIRLYLVSPTKYDWSDVAKSIAGGVIRTIKPRLYTHG